MNTQPTPPVRAIARFVFVFSVLPGFGAAGRAATTPAETATLPIPVVARFENFGEADGLPSHKVHSVLKTSDGKLWLGTNNGLCVREPDGKFRCYGTKDGLSHPVVLHIAEDPRTGDLWLATMQGVSRFSGGQFTVFAPTDDAFAKIDPATIEKLKTDSALLTSILTYHVVPGQAAPAQVVGEHKTVQGATLNVTGSGDALKVNDANVVCGGVTTTNAQVYLIDTVLMTPAQ